MLCVGEVCALQGRSEEYLGRWMRDTKVARDRIVIATKVGSAGLNEIPSLRQ